MRAIISNLLWQSDLNGDEIGYPEVPVVGLYYSESLNVRFYINTELNEVFEIFPEDNEE